MRRPCMAAHQTPQMPGSQAGARRQRIHAGIVECPVGDQFQRPSGDRAGAAPGGRAGRAFRPASEAGAKAQLLRRRRAGHETAVRQQRQARRADRAAIDPRRGHAGEEPAVETGIPAFQRAVAKGPVQLHTAVLADGTAGTRRFRTSTPSPEAARKRERRIPLPGRAVSASDSKACAAYFALIRTDLAASPAANDEFASGALKFSSSFSLEPAARSFLYGDVALATLDTPAANIPTWALLFSPLPDPGAIVCACLGVGVNTIRQAIGQGCAGVAALGQATGAGTNCGSCRPELAALLAGAARLQAAE